MQKAILPDWIEILFPHARKRARTMCSTLLRGPLFIPVGEIVFPFRPQMRGRPRPPARLPRPFRPISVLCNAEIYGPIGRGALSIRRGRMRGRGWNWNIDSCLSKGCRRILAVFSLSSIYFASASRRLERSQRTRIHLPTHTSPQMS